MLKVILKKDADSEKFLQEVKKLFAEDGGYKGLIIDGEGDFTYRAEDDYEGVCCGARFSYASWLRHRKTEQTENGDVLYFGIIPSKKKKLTKEVYSFYHTHFSRFLLSRFDHCIKDIVISADINQEIDIFAVEIKNKKDIKV